MISNRERTTELAHTVPFNAEDRVGIKLLENSVHFLTGEINQENITECIRWIVYENLGIKTAKVLTLYIDSTGGDLYEAFALIDIMRTSEHPIRVIGLGSVMSAAFLVFASGTQGERYAGKNTSFMCHQFSETSDGHKYHDLKATMKESDNCNQRMISVLKEATGFAVSKVKSKFLPASDVYMTAEEAVALNIADHIL